MFFELIQISQLFNLLFFAFSYNLPMSFSRLWVHFDCIIQLEVLDQLFRNRFMSQS